MTEKPNTDQSSDGSLPGKLKAALGAWLRGEVDDMIPSTVVSYNDATNRAVIKPIVMLGTTSGAKISRATVSDVPVFRFGGGGFFMRFPIKQGDFGWLKASDRDMSLIKQNGGREEWPHTLRQHSFSDGMFFPDAFRDWIIDGANADAMVIQSLDGGVAISLHDGKIRMEAPVIEMVGEVSITGGALTHNGVNVGSDHVHPINSGSSAPGPTGGPQ
jgi:hypothetical protein